FGNPWYYSTMTDKKHRIISTNFEDSTSASLPIGCVFLYGTLYSTRDSTTNCLVRLEGEEYFWEDMQPEYFRSRLESSVKVTDIIESCQTPANYKRYRGL
ncbi:MAG TPA: hypothetical protein VEC99_04370, partial [Clostridia bacterium]|nr:hypothetical protein [Clostridia bacterium]